MPDDNRNLIERTESLTEKLYGQPAGIDQIADNFALRKKMVAAPSSMLTVPELLTMFLLCSIEGPAWCRFSRVFETRPRRAGLWTSVAVLFVETWSASLPVARSLLIETRNLCPSRTSSVAPTCIRGRLCRRLRVRSWRSDRDRKDGKM